MRVRWAALLMAVVLQSAATPVAAVDLSFSAFGTLGFAQSNQPYTYQRFIDDGGTFWRDSLAGAQVDAKLSDTIGATVQVKLAPSTSSDNQYEATLSWAFLSWRPTNDWLFRAGKQRIPLYLYSQTYDVGVTYDFARLPTEMYSIIPSNDFVGLSVSKTWGVQDSEFALDGYWGKSTSDYRFWIRDNIPPVQSSGAVFDQQDVKGGGIVLSYRRHEDLYRVGLHRAVATLPSGAPFPTTFPFVAVAPGIGYYQVDDSLPGPGIPTIGSLTGTLVTLGAEVGLSSGFRVVGEFARTFIPDTDYSTASTRGYASLQRQIDNWTPYVVYAFLRSQPRVRNLYNNVNYNTVPDFVPDAAPINASQRTAADNIFAWDQHSWSVGTSYSFSAKSMLKAEYMRSHIGQMSSLVDAPSGSNIRDQNINVFSLNYNFVF